MDPVLALIAITSAGAVALGSMHAYERFRRPQRALRSRLEPRRDIAFNPAGVLRPQRRRLPLVGRLPISQEGRNQAQLDLDRAGVRWRVQEFLALRLLLSLSAALGTALPLLGVGFAPAGIVPCALLAMVIGWTAPAWVLGRRRRRRMLAIEAQLPDVLTAMAKSLRAGTGLLQALAYAAGEASDPLGPELQNVLRDLQLGADPVEAFGALSERVGSPDLDIAVTAIIIQRSVGGNLAEVLMNVTNTIRERAKIQREIQVLVARQMLQANLTAVLPVAIAALFIALSPDLGRTLVTTVAGNIALGGAAVCEVVGIYFVRRLAIIEV